MKYMEEKDYVNTEGWAHVVIRGGVSVIPRSCIYESEEDAMAAAKAQEEKLMDEYRSQCRSWENTVAFCIEQMEDAENPDRMAIEAVKEALQRLSCEG